jgi:hypothetical protein
MEAYKFLILIGSYFWIGIQPGLCHSKNTLWNLKFLAQWNTSAVELNVGIIVVG